MSVDPETRPTLLLTGCNGQLGFELQRRLAVLGRVIALDRVAGNLAHPAALRKTLREVHPDVIVNAAGYTDVERAETEADQAFAVNALAVSLLAEEAKAMGSLLVHYSTDYVFDGRNSNPYLEVDAANPLSTYGKSKLAGDLAIAQSGARALVFRTGWVAGAHGSNFAKTILQLGQERDVLRVIADRIGGPTTADLIADVTTDLVARYWQLDDRQSFPFGLYHVAATGQASWYDYAVEVLANAQERGIALKAGPERVVPISAADYPAVAQRPAYSCLDTSKLRQTFGIGLPDWKTGLRRLLDQIAQSPESPMRNVQ
ncbi:dTDP-4-dehydrorhamnose reductase [Ralstonia mannitolilytica]|jgi:dTDP-4-dehydrorhamnose reductase|uniref:dTDP-4-dehydrorhamnose reductase n=1 Tax=Ralstonia mannitolilytica TaxID=105219 RepID=UPI0028F66F6E|nr:dTDP-4-dehydrorhamnose reductase [Ralstonia mannitolilytica]CAJ0690678.1 dTDP-4-dehydrorhamnose reductase [Ralstonia mannitolilytica]